MAPPSQKYTIPVLLVIWFLIWGICPWSSSSAIAQPAEAAHAAHGHHGMDDTHHASKGMEHSCSGSISYSSKLQKDRPYEQVVLNQRISPSAETDAYMSQTHGRRKLLLERRSLPKRLTKYYQLYSVYRI